MGGAAVLLDVLVSAVLVGETSEKGFAREASGDVANTVFAFFGPAWKIRGEKS